MPSGFLNADIQMPDLSDAGKDVETRLKETQDYLYLLLENLRYTLNNLEPGNFNEAGLKAITDPITASIADADGRITQLAITAQGLASRVSDAEGNISTLEQTASGLSITVGTLAEQTTVYVNSQGMIIQNGTGRQVKIGNGAVKADFFYGNKYYDASGIGSLDLTSETNRHRLIFGLNGQSYANSDFAIDAYDDQGTTQYATMRFYGMEILRKSGFNTSIIYPQGTWNFSDATVTGISSVATFG